MQTGNSLIIDRTSPFPTWEDGAPSIEFIAHLKRDAPEGCLLCQLDDMDDK
jgi:hypothetical protein